MRALRESKIYRQAVLGGYLDTAQTLENIERRIQARSSWGLECSETALLLAVRDCAPIPSGDEKELLRLLVEDCEQSYVEDEQPNAFRVALMTRNKWAAEFLVERGWQLSSKEEAELLLEFGWADILAQMLKAGEFPCPLGKTLLHRRNLPPVVADGLIQYGADLEARDLDDRTPLMQAVQDLCFERPYIDEDACVADVKRLVEAGANTSVTDVGGESLLHYGAMTTRAEHVEFLIDNGIDVDARDHRGFTPLMTASYEPVVRVLVKHGADVNARSENGHMPLLTTSERSTFELLRSLGARMDDGCDIVHAAFEGWHDHVELLLDRGVDPNAKAYLETALHVAVRNDDSDLVALLLARGADLDARNGDGRTPLAMCAFHGASIGIARQLLSCGADIDARDDKSGTALHWAASSAHPEYVRLLITSGADVQAKDFSGRRPLHWAVVPGIGPQGDRRAMTVRVLLENGADIEAQDQEGKRPLHVAVDSMCTPYCEPFPEVVSLLIASGAKVNAQDGRGDTPIGLGLSHDEIVVILRNAGGDERLASKGSVGARHFQLRSIAMELDLAEQWHRDATREWMLAVLLWQAISMSRPDLAEALLDLGADVNHATWGEPTPLRDGPTPLQRAVGHSLVRKATCGDLLDGRAENRSWLEQMQSNGESVTGISLVKVFIQKGANLNSEDRDGQTPLYSAVGQRNREASRLLIEAGCGLNHHHELPTIVFWGWIDILELLIDRGIDIRAPDEDGNNLLHYSVNSPEMTRFLLAGGVDINQRNHRGETPLVKLIAREVPTPEQFAVVEALVDAGADVNRPDNRGRTPLHWAAKWRRREIAAHLSANGAAVDASDDLGATPLMDCFWATDPHFDSELCALLLLDKGAGVNVRDVNGETALVRAARIGDQSSAEVLMNKSAGGGCDTELHPLAFQGWTTLVQRRLEQGANSNARDSNGRTALHFARDSETIDLLLSSGADIDAKNEEGLTPLALRLTVGGSEEPAEALIVRGADCTVANRAGVTPLHWAALRKYKRVVRSLLKRGANATVKDSGGKTPLHYLASKLPLLDSVAGEIWKLLVRFGANGEEKDLAGLTPNDYAKDPVTGSWSTR